MMPPRPRRCALVAVVALFGLCVACSGADGQRGAPSSSARDSASVPAGSASTASVTSVVPSTLANSTVRSLPLGPEEDDLPQFRADGRTWATLQADGISDHNSYLVELSPSAVTGSTLEGIDGWQADVVAASQYVWLVPWGQGAGPSSNKMRFWRFEPATGAWLTADVDTASGGIVSDGGSVLWQRSSAGVFVIDQAEVTVQGSFTVPPEANAAGVLNGELWIGDGRAGTLVAYRPDGTKAVSYSVGSYLSAAPLGPSALLLEQPSTSDAPGSAARGAIISVVRVDPRSGALVTLGKAPAPDLVLRGGSTYGGPLNIELDRTGGWLLDAQGGVFRLPDSWFAG